MKTPEQHFLTCVVEDQRLKKVDGATSKII